MAKCDSHPLSVPVNEIQLSGGLKAHGILLTIATSSSLVAWTLSFYLIFRHLKNFTNTGQQKLIIRIIFMVPVYTTACVFSIEFYRQHVYLAAIYEFYESIVIASFFLLLCSYLHPDKYSLWKVFAVLKPRAWLHPVRFVRRFVLRRGTAETEDEMKWFRIIWTAILQFVVIKFFGALAKCITEGLDVYCKELGGAEYAKIWIQIIEILSLVTAMFCLLQFYSQCKAALSAHNPLLKFAAIKLVVFLFYVQSFILDRLTTKGGPLKPTDTISYPSLVVGIPSTLLCFEMAAVSVLHLWAYPWHVYSRTNTQKISDQTLEVECVTLTAESRNQEAKRVMVWWRAILHVLNLADIGKAVVDSCTGHKAVRKQVLLDRHRQDGGARVVRA